jgi:hypothetical protein
MHPPRRHPRAGYTLIEVLGAVLLAVALGSMVYAAPKPSPDREAADTALRMYGMLRSALTDAELDGSEVLVRAVSRSDGGRFLALAGAAGEEIEEGGPDWLELERGVLWRAGSAERDPMGAPTDGRVPGTIRCSAEVCETGAADYVVYFVGHTRNARVARALVLTRERDVQLFRWSPAAGRWEGGPR